MVDVRAHEEAIFPPGGHGMFKYHLGQVQD